MLPAFANFTAPLGRLLLSVIFILAGINKLTNWHATAKSMGDHSMPAVQLLLPLAVLCELGGGILVLVGWRARVGALALIVLLLNATLIFHNFWQYTGKEQQDQMMNFMKNMAILGGLFIVLTFGAGPVSIDAVLKRRDTPRPE
jgi:putative oxidoreductase